MGAQQKEWLDRLEMEHDNLRAALAWSLERGEMGVGLRLAGSLCRFWNIHGRLTEGRQWLTKALDCGLNDSIPKSEIRHPQLAATQAKVLEGAGVLAWQGGDYTEARALLEDSMTLYRALDNQRHRLY
jgi:non-specific serine/threonine protein kinase